eukprot:TRINITY_DN75076_c0_g1_i1.p1 TRINITY_DN75076_c0_g1~~TRINITY_DN75076_c0_g1_i1.p1  ORF type:complete len:295 (+),score=39.92 TRINITY_DN75076_c0_g1_i1:65-949(+)
MSGNSNVGGGSEAYGAAIPRAPPGLQMGGDAHRHYDIARDIGHQVESLILGAKRQSETKVSKEIAKVKIKIESMSDKIRLITERLGRLETADGSRGVLRSDLQKSIVKLEEVWEIEVSTLKHELWQTIQAHNHNADLLKHHKDAIDGIQDRMVEGKATPETELLQAQLMQVEKVVQREMAKEAQMEQLMQRLAAVQQQLGEHASAIAAGGQWPDPTNSASCGCGVHAASGYPASGTGATGGTAAAGKRSAVKKTGGANGGAKASKGAKAASLASLTLRAEAPEFVPTTAGWADT